MSCMMSDDAMSIWKEEDRLQKERDDAIMAQVKARVGEEVFADIEAYMIECGYVWDFKIANKPIGVEQDEDWKFGRPHVNQTTNGGWSGDDFAGTVSIPIGGSEFLEFSYSM